MIVLTHAYVLRISGKKALQDAGLDPEQDSIKDLDKARCGILIGSAMGVMSSFSNAVEALFTSGAPVICFQSYYEDE